MSLGSFKYLSTRLYNLSLSIWNQTNIRMCETINIEDLNVNDYVPNSTHHIIITLRGQTNTYTWAWDIALTLLRVITFKCKLYVYFVLTVQALSFTSIFRRFRTYTNRDPLSTTGDCCSIIKHRHTPFFKYVT